jgi:PKD repeat protein
MSCSSFSNFRYFNRGTCAAAFSLLAFLALASPAVAQECVQQVLPRLVDTSDNCVTEPWRELAKGNEAFSWKGHDYLMINLGNELVIYNVDNPTYPIMVDESNFNFGTVGDSDHDLLRFDISDESRFMVFGHKVARTVVVDLGVGSTPSFTGYTRHEAPDIYLGGSVFSKGGSNYLIAGALEGGCPAGSSLYLVNDDHDLQLIEVEPGSPCIELGGSPVKVWSAQPYNVPEGYFLYISAGGANQIYRLEGSGSGLVPAGSWQAPANLSTFYFFSIDTNNARAASSDSSAGVVQIWNLSTPSAPSLLYEIPATVGDVALRSPSIGAPSTLVAVKGGAPLSTRTWEVEQTSYREFAASDWSDPSVPFNQVPSCVRPLEVDLSDDGSAIFMARNSAHEIFDLATCLNPVPPIAMIEFDPDPVFPGGTVTVRDASSGSADRWALWITQGSNPGNPVLAGNSTMSSSNPESLNFPIPSTLGDGVEYYAHVEVESDDFSPPDDFDSASERINVERRPTVSISVEPETVIVTEAVDLSATVSGGSPTSYEWEVRGPGVTPGNGDTYFGQNVSNVTLDVSGEWNFDVTAHYAHDNPDGAGLYEAQDTYPFTVSSVAASFSWSPANPIHTEPITLNGSSSRPAVGLTYAWEVVERWGSGGYDSCPTSALCVIPAEALLPDTQYTVTLTVSNGTDVDTSVKYLDVGNGNVQPVITWSPTSPEIGETVLFSVDGVPVDIDKASWTLGGSGCDGADSTPECTPSLWNDCKNHSYSYSSSGTKTVNLSIEVGANVFTAPPVQITVQSSGSCWPGGGPTVCSYTMSPSSFEDIGANSTATRTFRVTTTSDCSWTANTFDPWITILTPGGQVSGTGTVRFQVSQNDGVSRNGRINIENRYVTVHQKAPYVPPDFTMSDNRPDIGEKVTFLVNEILEVASWDFGESNCHGDDPFINCSFLPPGSCNFMNWTFASSGEKTVTMKLTNGESKIKHPIVTKTGECCFKNGNPTARFDMSADEIYTGETVSFSDTSTKGLHAKALSFSWSPFNPEIGESVIFILNDVVGDVTRATWNFGEAGCDSPATVVCEPSLWNDCKAVNFSFASSGEKTVSVDVEIDGGAPETLGPEVFTVASAGSCDDGGGGGCSYSLNPTSASFTFNGGSGSFNVNTTAECDWTATPSLSFITVTSGEGSGPGAVSYTVAANPGGSRTGLIRVEGRNFRVNQAADAGDTSPTEWWWSITRIEDGEGNPIDQDVYSGTERSFNFTFVLPGRYRVRLTASNCSGSDYEIEYIDVLEAPIENFVVASAISSPGANGTQWESDFRFFNPCDDSLDVSLVYQPDNVDNTAKQLSTYPFPLGPNETMVFPSVREVVDGYEEETINGSILIDSVSNSGCKVLSVSRTFNQTPAGTLGLFVPAMPITTVGVDILNLTGLIRNDDYRSNLRLINNGDEEAWVKITVFGKKGEALTDGRSVLVKARSTRQINDVAGWAGVDTSLSQFTIVADVRTEGAIVDGFATVIDNTSGDSVMNSSSYLDEPKIWLPGVVFAAGRNDTFWQTDVWFHNPEPSAGSLRSMATYLHGKDIDINYVFEFPDDWPSVEAMGMRRRLDIAGTIVGDLGLENTSGYMIFEGLEGWMAPQISARTFTSDDSGGTFGLHLPTYGPKDLLQEGDIAYIVGISNSSLDSEGFRSNLGMLATDRTAVVEVTLIYPDGSQAEQTWETTVWAGQLKQTNNIFSKFGLGKADVTGTLKIEIVSGGDLIIYATEIDNQTGDSIFIPAQQKYMGQAR